MRFYSVVTFLMAVLTLSQFSSAQTMPKTYPELKMSDRVPGKANEVTFRMKVIGEIPAGTLYVVLHNQKHKLVHEKRAAAEKIDSRTMPYSIALAENVKSEQKISLSAVPGKFDTVAFIRPAGAKKCRSGSSKFESDISCFPIRGDLICSSDGLESPGVKNDIEIRCSSSKLSPKN